MKGGIGWKLITLALNSSKWVATKICWPISFDGYFNSKNQIYNVKDL